MSWGEWQCVCDQSLVLIRRCYRHVPPRLRQRTIAKKMHEDINQSLWLKKINAVYHEKTETPSAWRLIIILAIQLRKTEWKRPPGAMTWWRSLVLSVYLYTKQTDFLPKSTNSVVQIVCSFINNTDSWRVLYITTNSKFSNLPTSHLGVVLFLSLSIFQHNIVGTNIIHNPNSWRSQRFICPLNWKQYDDDCAQWTLGRTMHDAQSFFRMSPANDFQRVFSGLERCDVQHIRV
jgi:hypothetical protein